MPNEQPWRAGADRALLEDLTGELSRVKGELATLRAGHARDDRGRRLLPALMAISALVLALGTGLFAHALSAAGNAPGAAGLHRAPVRADAAVRTRGDLVRAPGSAASLLFCPACTAATIRARNGGRVPAAAQGAYWAAAHLASARLGAIDLTGATLRWAALEGADLRGALLVDADLRRANLRAAHLDGAQLDYTQLTDVYAPYAILSDATLRGADLSGANVAHVALSRATLSGANLTNAQLQSANISGADLTRANLTNADLRDVRGKAVWPSPGIIFHNTICPDGRNSDKRGGRCPGLVQAAHGSFPLTGGGGAPPIPQ